jgi:hypothetical protein
MAIIAGLETTKKEGFRSRHLSECFQYNPPRTNTTDLSIQNSSNTPRPNPTIQMRFSLATITAALLATAVALPTELEEVKMKKWIGMYLWASCDLEFLSLLAS